MSKENASVHSTLEGVYVGNAPMTTEIADANAPGLLTNSIDEAVTKIRPMATPLDQISRLGNVRRAESMTVDYYSVDTRADNFKIEDFMATDEDVEGGTMYMGTVSNPDLIEVSETFAIVGPDGVGGTGYIASKNGSEVRFVCSEVPDDDHMDCIRMGRAATQLDVQSPQFSMLPKKSSNQCQIFKMQVEQSLVMKLSHKEIGWSFNDQQEAAIYDMRLGMEKQFLFGHKMKFYDAAKGETVMTTQGIWHQAGRSVNVDTAHFDNEKLVDLLRVAFTRNSGSRRKVLLAGSALIAAINQLDAQRVLTAQDTVTSWGIDFSELTSKFGKLYVVFDEIFDRMGMPANGIIVDPNYIQKHVFIPFAAEKLDLRGSGQRNTEAMVLTEASCLTLRYPDAHLRVIGA